MNSPFTSAAATTPLVPLRRHHRIFNYPLKPRIHILGRIIYRFHVSKSNLCASSALNLAPQITTRIEPNLILQSERSHLDAEIQRFCDLGNLRDAMELICRPESKNADIDSKIFCSVLQLCADSGSLDDGKIVHSLIQSFCVVIDGALGLKLVYMYIKCGVLREARKVFDEMTERDQPLLWNLLIKEYVKEGDFAECLYLFSMMCRSKVKPDSYTFSGILKCCAALGSLSEGEEVHALALKMRFGDYNSVGNALIAFYSKLDKVGAAIDLFREMPDKDIISWNSIISGCVSKGLKEKGLGLFIEMWFAGVTMDLATLVSVLPACADLGTLEIGRGIHGYAVKSGLAQEVTLSNSLVDMYSKCSCLDSAIKIFGKMGKKSVVTWTSMISAYTRAGQFKEAMKLFGEMESTRVKPDLFAITTVLHACACNGSLEEGKCMHEYVARNGLEKNLAVANALMDMYMKCGNVTEGRSVFDNTCEKDIISWNTMIGGYSKNCLLSEALNLFREMLSHLKPNSVTMTCILPAAAGLSAFERGREIHCFILRAGIFIDNYVANALVDMYAKCGALLPARLLFDRIVEKDLVSWTLMIAGYGMHGHGDIAIDLFNDMRRKGIEPDEVSFVAILYACSHSRLVDEGWKFFNIMRNECRIQPTLEHYACMVDLLSRAGNLIEAYNFVKAMPIQPDSTVWGALLNGCRIHRNVKLAETVAERIFELEPEDTGYYILLSNIYADADEWEAVKSLRKRISKSRLQKNPGCSWIEIKTRLHVFVSGDRSHPQLEKINFFLKNVATRMKNVGYAPLTRYALLKEDDDRKKEEALCGHSEKLAIALGVLNSSNGKPIRVAKNLRVCGDCHEVAKFISKMEDREIILRDSNRFHHFKDGRCSCRDYW